MKKIISLLLMLTIIVGTVPLTPTAFASDVTEAPEVPQFSTERNVYYSDIFTIYSQYLKDETLLDIIDESTQNALIDTYDEFRNSEEYYDMINKFGFTCNLSDLAKMFSDAVNGTTYYYEDALDDANERFVNLMFDDGVTSDSLGSDKRTLEAINTVAAMMNAIFSDLYSVEYATEIDAYELLVTIAESDYIDSFWVDVTEVTFIKKTTRYAIENIDQFKAVFDVGTQGFVMVKALFLAMAMEIVRGEIAEDILSVAEPGTALYDGFKELNDDLGSNMTEYMVKYYIKNGALKYFTDAAEDLVIGRLLGPNAAGFNTTNLVIKAAAVVVYDFILDTPDLSEVTAFLVLARYADDLADAIRQMRENMITTAPDGHTISKYENLWCVYRAVNRAAWKLAKEISFTGNLNTMGPFSSYFGDSVDIYTKVHGKVISEVRATPVAERNITPASNYTYSSGKLKNAEVKEATNTIEDNTIYLVNDYIYGSVTVSGTDANAKDLFGDGKGSAGNLCVYGYTLTVPEGSDYTILGDVETGGYYTWASGNTTNYIGIVDNMGTLTVTGNINVYSDASSSYYRFNLSSDDALLRLYGNQNFGLNTHRGTVEFCGSSQQKAIGNYRNIIVTNPEGISGNIVLHGYFNANGTPFEGSVSLSDNAALSPGTNFCSVYISGNYTLCTDITANTVTVNSSSTLTVAEGTSYIIDADFMLYGYTSWYSGTNHYYKGIADIYGILTVLGDISYSDNAEASCCYLNVYDGGLLRFTGDQNVPLSEYSGTVAFFGDTQQKIQGSHKNINVTNPEGVTGGVYLHGYFNANSNPFEGSISLNNGATLSEGTNFGSVSISGDYTLGTDITADTVTVQRSSSMKVAEGTDYTIDADLILYAYYWQYNYYKSYVNVYGDLTLIGNVSYREDAATSYCYLNVYEGGVLRLTGDQNVPLTEHSGTVEFCGDTQQKIQGNHKNINVTNPEGVTGSVSLKGDFNANSNPFEGSVSLNNGATLSEGTNFGSVSISGDYTLGTDITADTVTVQRSSSMKVAEGTDYTIDADLLLYAYYWQYNYYKSYVNVYGDLTLLGNVSYREDAATSYCYLNVYEGGILRLTGDQNVPLTEHSGTVEFCGDTQQKIQGSHKNVNVTNPEGVTGSVSLKGYFNANSNPFDGSVSLYNGATLSEGTNFGAVSISGTYTLGTDITADTVTVLNSGTIKVAEGTDYTIDADLLLYGYYSYGTYYRCNVDIYGDLTLLGNVSYRDDADTSCCTLNVYEGGILRLTGDQNVPLTQYGGTVEFFGDTQQKIQGSHKNINVTNPEGVTGSVSLKGDFNANSNPFEGSVSLSNGATLSEGTNFGAVSISGTYTLGTDITADTVTVLSSSTMKVAEGTDYTIDADLILYGYYSYGTYYRCYVDVYGDLSVTGDIAYRADADKSYCYFRVYDGSTLRLSGNALQTVDCVSGNLYTVILENGSDEGVVFKNNIKVNTLFDHNGNKYTLNNGGTFTDYDNDGIPDNDDPSPAGTKIMAGDVYPDGIINGRDANILCRIISGNAADIPEESYLAADVNGDGQINGKDANILAKMIAGNV